uniref:ferroxidase n=1 Tax=Capra hircus TaxID=9925 RepID=A0A8C2NAJ8_CAPHI
FLPLLPSRYIFQGSSLILYLSSILCKWWLEFQSETYLQPSKDRIGSVYKKALYFGYTDDTFQTTIEKPSWLGFLDLIHVHVKNNASRMYSFHPHGLTYTKDNEGALYPDNTTGLQKEDDRLEPGAEYTYRWFVEENQGPGPNDSNCVTRMYHSHVDTLKDVSSGLLGPILTCKRGTLDGDMQRYIDEYFILVFSITDEKHSWYFDDNIRTYTEAGQVNANDPDFKESNVMRSINGYLYANLPDLTMCAEDRVMWHFISMGTLLDMHPIYFHGQTLISQNHRKDTITVFPASMRDAFMVAKGVGEWLLDCRIHESMQAFFSVRDCQKSSADVTGTQVVHYYIAAKEIFWDYAPSGINFFSGNSLTEAGSESHFYFEQGPTRIGGTYKKLVYFEYTDASFQTQKAKATHLGLLGPVIKAEVGQIIQVTFYNNASLPLSIHPHGLLYNKNNEGTPSPSSHVNPVPTDVGPTSTDPKCLTWSYFSSVDFKTDINSGLIGPLLVCRNGSLGEDGKQKGIDKEFYLLVAIFDENRSYLLDKNIRIFTTEPENVDTEDPNFQESNKMYSINGYMYGNLPGLDMCLGDNVSWHVLSVGSSQDFHGIYFSGNTFTSLGSRDDTISVTPHISQTLLMTPDSIGKLWIFSISLKYAQTMKKQCLHIREWERELHRLQGQNKTNIYLDRFETYLGSKYKKVVVYRQYDDITFTNQTVRSEDEIHLDILGPIIFLTPGEKIYVVFKNKASRPYSIHAHGVKTDNPTVVTTQPGEIRTYVWQIPERSGPTSNDFECIPWFYYSTVDMVKDLNSGLVGPLIVCRKDTKENIVHRVLFFMTFDENESWYIEENINAYAQEPNQGDRNDITFKRSNKMPAINGRMFANNQGLVFHVGSEVNWYLIGIGDEFDLHTVHFHGHSFVFTDMGAFHSDVYDLPPGSYQTVKMYPRDVGIWLFHCHVHLHIGAGMESVYTVIE